MCNKFAPYLYKTQLNDAKFVTSIKQFVPKSTIGMCNFDNNYLNYGAKFAPNIKLFVQTADIYTAAEKWCK